MKLVSPLFIVSLFFVHTASFVCFITACLDGDNIHKSKYVFVINNLQFLFSPKETFQRENKREDNDLFLLRIQPMRNLGEISAVLLLGYNSICWFCTVSSDFFLYKIIIRQDHKYFFLEIFFSHPLPFMQDAVMPTNNCILSEEYFLFTTILHLCKNRSIRAFVSSCKLSRE